MSRFAYADPPYPGQCSKYEHHHPDGKCWDDLDTTYDLIVRLQSLEFDGFVLHTSSVALSDLIRPVGLLRPNVRIMAWVKPFAAFKRNVSVAYAWEPVLVKPVRKPVVSGRIVMRDWLAESITLKRGLTGAKPERVCRWLFEVAGLTPDDELHDLFPGTGAVGRAWDAWREEVAAA